MSHKHPLAGQSCWIIPLTGSGFDGCVTTEVDGKPRICVFKTERAAMLEVADHVSELIECFKRGERDDWSTEEGVIEADIDERGHVIDESEHDWGVADDELEEEGIKEVEDDQPDACNPRAVPKGACCANENRSMAGGCLSCGAPCF